MSLAAAAFVPPLVASAPAASVLVVIPPALAVTFTVTVQLPLAGIVPPVRRTLPSPASSVVSASIASFSLSAPPQVLPVESGSPPPSGPARSGRRR